MSAAAGLRRQVVLTMSAVTLAVVVLCVLGSYAFYALLLTFHPASVSDGWMPSSVELAWVLLTLVIALLIAIFVATRLSRRILPSLDSVAISLRQLAQGDLSARAHTDDSALHEAAQAGEPWQNGKAILSRAGSKSLRMADVFKSQKDWRHLIRSDRRGGYRLNLD